MLLRLARMLSYPGLDSVMYFGRILRKLFPTITEFAATFHFRTYLEDGLMTRHNADFLQDARFTSAFHRGKETKSWGNTSPRWRVHVACWAAETAASLAGDFVECGVNRGGLALAIMEYLNFNSLDKRFFLFDTYYGFPRGAQKAEANSHDYSECYNEVLRTFQPFSRTRIVRGIVPDSLDQIDSKRVCFLSLDMNSAEPEIAALRHFWPRLTEGAIVLLDDYGGGPSYKAQKNAFDKLATEMRFSILTLPTGQGMIIKPPS